MVFALAGDSTISKFMNIQNPKQQNGGSCPPLKNILSLYIASIQIAGEVLEHQILHPGVSILLAGLAEQHHQNNPFQVLGVEVFLIQRHGAVNVMSWRDDGFLAEAMINYLVRLGWSHGDEEIFSRAQLVEHFSIDDVNHSASRFDVDKLRWLNQHYIKTLDPAQLSGELAWHCQRIGLDTSQGPSLADVVVALRERAATLLEMAEKARVWFEPLNSHDPQAVAKHLGPQARPVLTRLRERLAGMTDWQPARIDAEIRALCEELGLGLGKVAAPLRVALTGTQVSPSIDHTVYLCGQSEAVARIERAMTLIGSAD